MPDQFCPNCGTEVDEDARFCPSCGTTLTPADTDEADIPPAPAWPPPDVDQAGEADAADDATRAVPAPGPPAAEAFEASPDVEAPASAREPAAPEPPVAAPPPAAPPPAASGGEEGAGGSAAALPFTWPTMLSGWLIGGGSVVGALVLIPRLAGNGYLVSLLLFLALLGIAATVFLADHVPAVPHLRLITLSTTLIGLGVALARAAFAIQGVDTLLLVAMLAAAGGAVLLELDMDRPFPPPADRRGA